MDDNLIWMTTYETPMFLFFNFKMCLYFCLLGNETNNPQHLDCGRSIPATHGGQNDSRLGGASSPHQGVVDSYNLSKSLKRQWINTSRLICCKRYKSSPCTCVLQYTLFILSGCPDNYWQFRHYCHCVREIHRSQSASNSEFWVINLFLDWNFLNIRVPSNLRRRK